MDMDAQEARILQRRLARFLIDDVFNTVSEKDILRIEPPKTRAGAAVWYYRGEPLQAAQVEALKKQARVFAESDVWRMLKNELLWHANQKGLVQSQTAEDIVASKVLIYLTDVIDSKLRSMSV